MSTSPTVHTKLDLSDSSSYLPSNLFQPRTTFFNRKQSNSGIQQLLLRRNRLDSLRIYAKALSQLKQHLTELSLRENNFITFPSEVTVLKNLTSLSLANNQLKFIENEMLSPLIHLQWLNLSHNQLTELPLDIVCCHHLRGLDLEDNLISNFPIVIFYLTRLEVLLIQKNQMKSIPANYDFSPTINTLNLSFNQFTQIPTTLLYKPPASLTHLHLSGNKLRNLSPKFLSIGYKKLVSLDLHTCQLTRCSPKLFERLSKCSDLRRLNLAINRLTDLPSEIGLLHQLQWLNLNDNLISVLPSTLSDLIHLVKLGLVQNKIQVLPPFIFLHMLELQKLDIRRNQLKYMPPSILALAPRQEVDTHVDLAVPHTVFQSLSNPVCNRIEKTCLDGHPYGGSLRTLLFYENPTVEHVDGILCDLGDDSKIPESVQTISMLTIFNILKSNPSRFTTKNWLRQKLFPIQNNVFYCHHSKFKRSDHPMPNMLSEIDDEGNESQEEQDIDELNTIRMETQKVLTEVVSLREMTLRYHLTRQHTSGWIKEKRLDQSPEKTSLFIKHVLPHTIVPTMIQLMTLQEARQCDFCACWYTDSRFQIGYLARMCNNRLQIPIRFNVCSTECTLDAVIRLYQTTTDWHTRQSLAHIDATLLLPTPQPSEITRPNTSANYWNVGLSRSPVISATRSPMHRTLGLEQENTEEEEQENIEEEEEQENTVQSNTSSTTTLSTVSTLSLTRQSSLARSLRNRVVQLASTIFNYNQELSRTQLLPLVFPQSVEEPPSVVSVTTRMVNGRLHTERTQPQLRLASPTPNPTAFHHLPRDAIRLEKF